MSSNPRKPKLNANIDKAKSQWLNGSSILDKLNPELNTANSINNSESLFIDLIHCKIICGQLLEFDYFIHVSGYITAPSLNHLILGI